jgi:ribosomal protein S18 acetylase RimI-like enzyme
MSSSFAIAEAEPDANALLPRQQDPFKSLKVEMLNHQDQTEVLAFLSLRPIHTIYMAGLIRDNSLVSPLNRGTFYAYRNREGKLEGVALLGQKTVIEAHSENAFEAFAQLTLDNPHPHLIRGELTQIERLLARFSEDGRQPRLTCRELLLEQLTPLAGAAPVPDLRPATFADLEQVISINAMMAFEENGVNPLERDAQGVCQRVIRRIEQGREWVLVERGRIIFKADVISETPEMAFVEGVYVHPEERGRGYGFRCLTQLGHRLLARAAAICLVVNAENQKAQALYQKSGYQLHSHYRTVYF